jgi:hypothetical protein
MVIEFGRAELVDDGLNRSAQASLFTVGDSFAAHTSSFDRPTRGPAGPRRRRLAEKVTVSPETN